MWGLRFDSGINLVAVHRSRLRARLDAEHPGSLIETVSGGGWRLAAGGWRREVAVDRPTRSS